MVITSLAIVGGQRTASKMQTSDTSEERFLPKHNQVLVLMKGIGNVMDNRKSGGKSGSAVRLGGYYIRRAEDILQHCDLIAERLFRLYVLDQGAHRCDRRLNDELQLAVGRAYCRARAASTPACEPTPGDAGRAGAAGGSIAAGCEVV